MTGTIKRLSVVTRAEPGAVDPTPDSILGPLLHSEFRATDEITLGTGVSSWGNLTANGDLVQATGSKQPAYSASAFNGGPCVVGDGSNDELIGTVTGLASGQRPYAWVVLQRVAAVSADYIFCLLDTIPNGPNYLALHTVTNWFSDRGLADGTENKDTGLAADNNRHLVEIGATTGGTACVVVDGVGYNGVRSGALAADLTRMTAFSVVTGGFASVRIAHMIVASDEPSGAQIAAIRTYLKGANFPLYTGGSYGLPS